MPGDAGELRATLSLENKQFLDAMKGVQDAVDKGTEQIGGAFQQIAGFASAMGEALSALGIAGGLQKLGAMALDVVKKVDSLHSSFIALNGATEETEKLFADLQELEKKSNFDFEDTIGPAAKSMLQLGVSADLVKKAIQGLIDETAALKLPAEHINNVAEIFARMNQQVVVTERNMKQLTGEGVQAWDALAKKLGTSVPEAVEKVKAGMVSAREVIEAVAQAAEDRFGGKAVEATTKWYGTLNQLKQAGEDVLEVIGRSMLDMLNGLAKALQPVVGWVKELAKWFGDLPDPVKQTAIAFTATAVAATTLSAILPVLGTALVAVGAAFMGWPAIISIVVAGFVLLGNWIKNNWGPITATLTQAWEGVTEVFSSIWLALTNIFKGGVGTVSGFFTDFKEIARGFMVLWDPLVGLWKMVWDSVDKILTDSFTGIISVVTGAWDLFKKFLSWVGQVGAAIPGMEKLNALGETWDKEQKKAGELAEANKKLEASRKAEAEASAEQRKEAKQLADDQNKYSMVAKALGIEAQQDLDKRVVAMKAYETQLKQMIASGQGGATAERDLAAAHQAVIKAEKDAAAGSKNLTEARKQAADEAKKRADEAKKNAEEIKKAYDALREASPELAAQFSAAMGGISDSSEKAVKATTTLGEKMGASFATQAKAAFELADAYKTLGVTSVALLTDGVDKADKAFAKVSATMDGSAAKQAEYVAVLDALYAAHQKVADFMNRDLKEAWDKGLITADAYYKGVLDRAVKNAADLLESGTATQAQLLAADKQVADARLALAKNNTKELGDAYHALGEKTVAELAKTAGEFQRYADMVKKTAGDGSKLAIEAQIKALESARSVYQALGKDTTKLDKQIEDLQKQLTGLLPPVQRLDAAFKALGVTSLQALGVNAKKAADAMGEVTKAVEQGRAGQSDLYEAQQKVNAEFQAIADKINKQMKDAFERGEMTQSEYAAAVLHNAEEIEAAYLELAKNGKASLAELAAAHQLVVNAQKTVADGANTLASALKTVGGKTKEEYAKAAAEAHQAYETIADSAGKNSRAALQAWKNYLEILKKSHDDWGTEWTAADQRALDATDAALAKFNKKAKNYFKDFFDSVKQTGQKFADDILGLVLFGKGSSAEQNRELEKQEADLQKSLADRTKEWEAYQADIAKRLGQATSDYHDALAKNDQETADSLDAAAKDYAEYAAEIQGNIDDIVAKHQQEAADETKAAEDALADKRQAYQDYADDVAQSIEDIHEKYAEQLRQEDEDLAKSLRDRAEQYADFVNDANKQLSRVGQDTATNIADETSDTKRNIAEKTTDYNRYVEDTLKKIAAVREKNKGANSQEEDDLRLSITRKKEDLDEYIDEQNEKLDRYVRDQQERLKRENEDYTDSLAQKTRDYEEFQSDTQKKYDEDVAAIKDKEDAEVAKQEEALAKKAKDLDDFTEATKKKIEDIQTTHATEQDAEVAKQEEALAKKTKAYNEQVEGIKQKSEEQRVKIEGDYESATTKLNEELAKQSADYEAFKQDIIGPEGKLEQLKAKHKSIWDDIGTIAKGALGEVEGALTHLISEELWGAITGKFTGFKDLISDIGKGVEGILGIGGKAAGVAGKAADVAGGAADAAGGAAGGAGKAASGIASSAFSSVFSMVTGAITAITGVFSIFQNMHQETSLNAIEHNTRYSMMYLGDRSDGGILGVLFKIDEELAWGAQTKATENLRDIVKDYTNDMRPVLIATRDAVQGLGPYITDIKGLMENIKDNVGDIETGIKADGGRSINITVNANGVTTAEAARVLGNQIAANLATQLVGSDLR